ncbi:helicase associated domain protein [Cystoisospora suis]|uniref:Helicase associated domain protein n=1 Tax=Cystoisospora suis TaxID=483139 RepID=A0A2C6KPK7_9APIC|nr:helicase associated domain protein [Cystoisospora suis]
MCGAYCHSPRRTAFCRRFGLNAKRMKEMYLLANQLARLLVPSLKQQATACSKARVSQIEQDTSTEKAKRKNRKSAVPAADASVVLPLKPAPPTPAMRLALHACVVEGFIDHVAVWVEEETRGDFTGVQAPATNNRQRRGGYRSAELKNAADGRAQLAHIHPHSCLARHRLFRHGFIRFSALRDPAAVFRICRSVLVVCVPYVLAVGLFHFASWR